MNSELIARMVSIALAEDIGDGDVTAELIPVEQQVVAEVITREKAVVCGLVFVEEVFRQVDTSVEIAFSVEEGDLVSENQSLFEVCGNARSILTAERCALNFLQFLSGTASVTKTYIDAMGETNTQLLDTRKTIPLFRQAQKYAVTCGGGKNHRIGLYDAFLIKENHILACGSIEAAVLQARKNHDDKWVEVEVESLAELKQAIAVMPDVIMLDNFSLDDIRQAVSLRPENINLEISGNVNLTSIKQYADLGVDFISVGAITKHVTAIDLSMRVKK